MHKKIAILSVVLIIGCVGCNKNMNNIILENEKQIEKQVSTDEILDVDTELKGDEIKEDLVVIKKIEIFYVDEETLKLSSKQVEWDNKDFQFIWDELKKYNIVPDESEIYSLDLNETDKTIDMNFDKKFGDYVRSMGTAGEDEILTCVVNTYLEAYECEKIKLLEETEPFATSSAELFGYMGKLTLE